MVKGRDMKEKNIVFKGTKEGIWIIVNESYPLSQIYEEIDKAIGEAQYFFNGAQVIFDVGDRDLDKTELDNIKEIIVERYHLELIRVEGREWQWKYCPASHDLWEKESKNKLKKDNITGKKDMNNNHYIQNGANALLIKRTIRSGQRVEFDGNVIILGDVNPGSEIIAGGDIIVMGTLRGIAHAGAKGNDNAVVTAFYLKPMQLRIAQYITRAPDGEMQQIVEPEIARVKDGTIMIEKYIPNRDSYGS